MEELPFRVINEFIICIPVYLSSSIGYIAVYQWWLSLASPVLVAHRNDLSFDAHLRFISKQVLFMDIYELISVYLARQL